MSTIVDEGGNLEAQCMADSEPAAPQTSPEALSVLLEATFRACAAVMLGIFSYAAILQWRAHPGRVTLLLMVISGCFTVGLSLFSRVPIRRDWTPFAYICSIGGTYYFLAAQLGPGIQIVPEAVGVALQVAGICWHIFAKASLRRSFGILPANRGVVSTGAYRFVRHPMYLGYFIADIGFLLSNFGIQNLLVYGGQFTLQVARIWREERLMSSDESYCRYKEKVRYRVIPRVF
jgi:protein-S-isoprenylcysteine O-methyltransferase Ste14